MALPVVQPARLPALADGAVSLLQRDIGSIEWANNQKRKYDVKEQPNQIKYFCLHCAVGVTTATLSVTPDADAPFNLLKNIRVRSTQSLTLKNFPGIMIDLLNHLEFGTLAHNTMPASLDAGTYTWEFDIVIPFEDHTGKFPERTILNTVQYNDLTLFAEWADFSVISPDWVSANDNVDFFYCNVVSLERLPVAKAEETLNRQQMIDRVQTKRADTVDGFLLPENTMVKTLMVVTRDGNGDRVDNVISNLNVNFDSGNFILRDMSADEIQSLNKQYYHVEQLDTGVYVIEFDLSHDFSTLFNTKDRNYARLDWTQATPPVADATLTLLTRRIATPKQLTD